MSSDDTASPAEFYATARGVVAARLVRECLERLWPNARGECVLGIGHAHPYLRLWRHQARRCIALVPSHLRATPWPSSGSVLTCRAEEHALPFADLSFDRVLVTHALEKADNARALLRQIWRVLKDDGRLLVVVPHRSSMWAYAESTPFGHGQPFSQGQLARLLAANLFRAERSGLALYVPPSSRRFVLRGAHLAERIGPRIAPALGGVIWAEAVKDAYAALPLKPAPRRRLVLADTAA